VPGHAFELVTEQKPVGMAAVVAQPHGEVAGRIVAEGQI
jgi:hypothetical protein